MVVIQTRGTCSGPQYQCPQVTNSGLAKPPTASLFRVSWTLGPYIPKDGLLLLKAQCHSSHALSGQPLQGEHVTSSQRMYCRHSLPPGTLSHSNPHICPSCVLPRIYFHTAPLSILTMGCGKPGLPSAVPWLSPMLSYPTLQCSLDMEPMEITESDNLTGFKVLLSFQPKVPCLCFINVF